MTQDMYRVLSRTRAMGIGVVLLATVAAAVWFAVRWMNASADEFARLFEQTPEQGALEIVRRLRMYAWLYGGSFLAIAAWTAWVATRSIQSGRMPPPGSWIIEGQRTWQGEAAVKRGRILRVVAGVLALLAGGMFLTLWRLAATIAIPGP